MGVGKHRPEDEETENVVTNSDRWEKRSIFRIPKGTPHYALHPTEARELLYGRIVVPAIKLAMRFQGVQLTLEGSENLPAKGGALLAYNHTGYLDFIFGGTFAALKGHRLVRFMAKKEIFEGPVVGALMRGMHHIPVDRSAGAASLDEAVVRLQEGHLVGIFPEATISRSFEIKDIKTGAVRIASRADVPLIPVAMWGSQRLWTKDHPRKLGRRFLPVWIKVGAPIDPSGDPDEATARLRRAMQELLDEVRADYESTYGPFPGGEFWRPASMGGSAPTMDRAAEIDAEEKRLRALRKAEKAVRPKKSVPAKLVAQARKLPAKVAGMIGTLRRR